MTWPLTLEAYEALDVLERWTQVTLAGKTFRHVAGESPQDKLFWLRNRPVGLQELFPLADAARFAVHGELSPRKPDGYEDIGLTTLAGLWPHLTDFQGFIAEEDCIEVREPRDKGGRPSASWFVPVARLAEFPEPTVVRDKSGALKILKAGEFALRVPHKDTRGGSAYYTPDLLAECVAKYTLEERLKSVDSADDILKLTVCDPCMGANATFLLQASLQLSHAYLERKQRELEQYVSADMFVFELRRVQRHFVANQLYGVELDPGAVEIAKMCLKLSVLP